MSRIGKKPVVIPAGVEIKTIEDKGEYKTQVKGPKGTLVVDMIGNITAKVDGTNLVVERKNETTSSKALHGLYRSLIQNAVVGVTEGYTKQLEIQGIGYKAELSGNTLNLKVGYSHPIVVTAPEGIKFEVKDGVLITITGIDKQLVGQAAANIRSKREPEPYKGKGIRYKGEVVRRKAGKAAAKTAA
ncbi:MAG: 50S ribosomal protein L6 [bacterium]